MRGSFTTFCTRAGSAGHPGRHICATWRPANLHVQRSARTSTMRGRRRRTARAQAAAWHPPPPGVVLLRCAYDIRTVFETGIGKAVPPKRDTPLAVAIPPGIDRPRSNGLPQVFELPAVVFDLLCALDHWTDPGALAGLAEPDLLIRELAEHGLLDVHR